VVPTALLLIAGALILAKRRPTAAALSFAVLAVPFLALFIASRYRPVFGERYLLLVAPALYALLGVGLAYPIAWARKQRLAARVSQLTTVGLAVVLVSAVVLTLGSYYRDRGGEGPGGWRPHVRWVVDTVAPGDLVLVNHLDPTFHYYYLLMGGTVPTMVSPPKQGANNSEVDAQLRADLSPGRRVFLVHDTAHIWDPGRVVRQWLERNAVPIAVHDVVGKDVVEFRVPAGRELGVDFGGLLRLERLEVRGLGANRAPATTMTADLVWQVLAKTNADYSVSLQLVDAEGRLAAQSDGPPRKGQVRTYEMAARQTVIDTRSLPLPPASGRYRLGVAVYDYASGVRLPIAGSADNMAWVAEVVVQP
jgi:hypothetical protein